MAIKMVWPRFKVFWFYQDKPTEHTERKKKKKKGRQKKRWKIISKRGQEWTLPAQLEQLKTEQDGNGLLRIHDLWCPDDLPKLRDRIK